MAQDVYVLLAGGVPYIVLHTTAKDRSRSIAAVFDFPFNEDWEKAHSVTHLVTEIAQVQSWVAITGEIMHPDYLHAVAFLARKTGVQPVVGLYNPHYLKSRLWSLHTQEDCYEDSSQWR